MTEHSTFRLEGLEPDNLLAFLSLLGLLRTLEHVSPHWHSRVAWTVSEPPIRPLLQVSKRITRDEISDTVANGLKALSRLHDFGKLKDLKLSPETAREKMYAASEADRYTADLWAGLTSDAAQRKRDKTLQCDPTPLCLLFGQGRMHFMERLASVPQIPTPSRRTSGRLKERISDATCFSEALFATWRRPDATPSFRWDPHEDVRHALRATDPTDTKTKSTTQHGANRLACIGLSALTVAPWRPNVGGVRLRVLGGDRDGDRSFVFTWPIWRHPISLAAIRGLLGHPGLTDSETRAALGVTECRQARRISVGKYMNFTRAAAI